MAGPKTVVILVDNKQRDLLANGLIAMQLEALGVRAFLEPLEAYRGVLAAYRPDVIAFNHLNANHLANYSARLSSLGVKVAVLPNELLLYNPDVLDVVCRKRNPNAHIDLHFCWSEVVRDALTHNGLGPPTRLEVVGNPRFDFYFEPWSRVCAQGPRRPDGRPRILLCTNLAFAHYKELPPAEADKVFALWSAQIPLYRRYWEAIEVSYRSRQKVLEYVRALLEVDRFEVILRPHPGEPASFYRQWMEGLDAKLRTHLSVAADEPIQSLILGCDLEISCETCTTALESWLCRKPTIELVFERHPMLYHPEVAKLNVECERPGDLVPLVERELARPDQPQLQEVRRAHLRKWCASPDGNTCAKIARMLAEVAAEARPQIASGLTWSDRRRSAKLEWLRRWDLPYSFDPFLGVKSRLFPAAYREKVRVSEKTIRPSDVVAVNRELAECVGFLSQEHRREAESKG
jgi:surface carbohydrate biosynthesis protein